METTENLNAGDDAGVVRGVASPDAANITFTAMRTPAYLVLSLLGLGIALAALAPWAGVRRDGGSAFDFASSVTGVDAGGWGAAAIVAGIAMLLLGLIGYFVNPFSDPEARFIVAFGVATLVAAIWKLLDVASIVDPDNEFNVTGAAAGPGLWLIAAAALLAVIGALAILATRNRVQL